MLMTADANTTSMCPTDENASTWPDLIRERKAILVADVVESVRLMQQDESDTIDRWRRFVNETRTHVLPVHGGRMVKSLGDGMLVEFEQTCQALSASLDMHRRINAYNSGRSATEIMALRSAVHVSEVVVDAEDVFGAGVNLTARLAALGAAGETLLSEEARDELVPGIDAVLEDLGPCWLKHIERPVRVFRASAPSGLTSEQPADEWRPDTVLGTSIAFIPLCCSGGNGHEALVGDIVADGVIHQLSRTPELVVISRLSTAVLRDRDLSSVDLPKVTGARYVVSGSFAVSGPHTTITIELADTSSRRVVWMERARVAVAELFEVQSQVLDDLAQGIHHAILRNEASRVASQPLPSLEAYALLFGGVGLLHRASALDFSRAGQTLTALSERVPRNGQAYAWLAQWHCIRIARGVAVLGHDDRVAARQRIEQALQRDPDCALAWSLRGMVTGWVDKDLVRADQSLQQALARNASEPLAWLYTCTLRSWQGRAAEAAAAGERALALSRLHPMRYYYETLAASGFLADNRNERAIELCESSLRAHCTHTPTYRVLAIAQWRAGGHDAARKSVSAMLRLQPGLTVKAYLDNYPGGHAEHALAYAEILREAGLPA
jgi:adenylate cyclase